MQVPSWPCPTAPATSLGDRGPTFHLCLPHGNLRFLKCQMARIHFTGLGHMAWGPIIHGRARRILSHWDLSSKSIRPAHQKAQPHLQLQFGNSSWGPLSKPVLLVQASLHPVNTADPRQSRTSSIQELCQFQKGTRNRVNDVPRECKLYFRSLSLKRTSHIQILGTTYIFINPPCLLPIRSDRFPRDLIAGNLLALSVNS